MKSQLRKYLLIILSVITIVIVIGWLGLAFFPEKIVPFMINRQIDRLAQSPDLLEDNQSITVFTVGTGSPMPGGRVQTGTAVLVNGHFFMFDVGAGVVQKAENIRLPLNQLDGVFITHWHSDHFMDLPNLINRSWVLGRKNDLNVYGPQGLDTIMKAVDQFLHIENQYRVDHHGEEIMDISKATAISNEFNISQGDTFIVYDQDGITITAFDVDHDPVEPAVGYVITYRDKKVVISGDTKKNDLLLEMAKDSDLLIHDVMLMSLLEKQATVLRDQGMIRNSKIVDDIQNYHTSPLELAELANKANVKKLVLSHFAPAPDFLIIKNLYQRELKGYHGPIHFANDGDMFIIK